MRLVRVARRRLQMAWFKSRKKIVVLLLVPILFIVSPYSHGDWRAVDSAMADDYAFIDDYKFESKARNGRVVSTAPPSPVTEHPLPLVMRDKPVLKELNISFTDIPHLRPNISIFATYSTISIQYSEYSLQLPRFATDEDKDVFLRNDAVRKELGALPLEKRAGQISLVRDGVYISDIDCSYKSDMVAFRRHSAKSRKVKINEEYVVPLIVPDSNYFQHFVDGVLPKLLQVMDFVRGSSKVKFLLRAGVDKTIGDMLTYIGISPAMILPYGRGYIRSAVQINTCITPPMHPQLMKKIRNVLNVADISTQRRTDQHVLLVLRDSGSNKRSMVNEAEVVKYLQDRYQSKLKLFKTARSLDYARKKFANASIIIGVHGGALYNILLAPSDATVVEIMPTQNDGKPSPSGLSVTIFWQMAHAIGQGYWRMPESPLTRLGAVEVSVDKLGRILDRAEADC